MSLSAIFNSDGIFKKAKSSANKYNEAKAREVLETVLVSDAQTEKYSNPKYNQDDFLDDLIKSEIKGADVKGDVAIIGEYAFELDRSIPRIGKNLGKASDLVFPELNVTVKLADDNKNASITIKAKEEKNGIDKIEIWQAGERIEEFPYEKIKTEITKEYTTKQNGEYIVKVYSALWVSTTVKVEGIKASVEFEANGSEEWKKSHSTTLTVQETADKVVSAKYCWTNSVVEPADDKFTSEFKSGDTITENSNTLTGTYYLWTMLETESKEKVKWRSEGFNFDNQGPNITVFTSTAVSYSSFKLNLTALDKESGIAKYEFFINGTAKEEQTVNNIKTNYTQEMTVTNVKYGDNSCYVIVTDTLGHTTRKDITAKTLLDTTVPTISSFTATKYSETGITLSATAQDTGTGVVKFEFYIDNVLKGTETCTATTLSVTKSKTITGISTGSHTCKVIVYDAKNYTSSRTTSGTTKRYKWKREKLITPEKMTEVTKFSSKSEFIEMNTRGSDGYTYGAIWKGDLTITNRLFQCS